MYRCVVQNRALGPVLLGMFSLKCLLVPVEKTQEQRITRGKMLSSFTHLPRAKKAQKGLSPVALALVFVLDQNAQCGLLQCVANCIVIQYTTFLCRPEPIG